MADPHPLPLATIAALARAGAVARAWELFAALPAGAKDSAAKQGVLGRLLKTRARLAPAEEARRLFTEAAAAYARADALEPAPYLLINAASAALLAGDGATARERAQQVLERLDGPIPVDDTPYFLAATRAEALLLLGDCRGAAAAMEQAVRADPDGWDDRAVTIAQLGELCAAQGFDQTWLEGFRPPVALHFAGHMGLVPGGAGASLLAAQVAELLAEAPVGFAYGALAAGADLIIAEQLLTHGAELNVVLPAPVADFRRQSVAPAGADWTRRFDAALERAASLQVVGPPSAGPHDPRATALAGDVAIGGSLTAARRYATRARQWVVLDTAGGGANSAAQATRWPDPASQLVLTVAREGTAAAAFPAETNDPGRHDRVALAIRADLSALGALPDSGGLARLHAVVEAALGAAATPMRRAGEWDVLFAPGEDPARAALAVLAAARAQGLAVSAGLARGLVSEAGAVAAGPPLALAERLALRAPAGVALADGLFAATSALAGRGGWQVQPYLAEEPELGGTAWLLGG